MVGRVDVALYRFLYAREHVKLIIIIRGQGSWYRVVFRVLNTTLF